MLYITKADNERLQALRAEMEKFLLQGWICLDYTVRGPVKLGPKKPTRRKMKKHGKAQNI